MRGLAQHLPKEPLQRFISKSKNNADWALELLEGHGISLDEDGMMEEGAVPAEFAVGGDKEAGRDLLGKVVTDFTDFAVHPASRNTFYAKFIEPFPEAKAVWDANIDDATNAQLGKEARDQASLRIVKELVKIIKDTLVQLEEEIEASPVYGPEPEGFFDVVSDVCRANRGASSWKLGVISATKYAVFDKI